jgi:hypothetical protein
MKTKLSETWFSVVSIILVLARVFFALFGLDVLPVNKDVLLQWESAIYGAIMIGWGGTLLLAGRLAFRRNDTELMKILLVGLAAWLIVEAKRIYAQSKRLRLAAIILGGRSVQRAHGRRRRDRVVVSSDRRGSWLSQRSLFRRAGSMP